MSESALEPAAGRGEGLGVNTKPGCGGHRLAEHGTGTTQVHILADPM